MSLMLINPRARRKTKKRRSAAQRAATSRMLAARRGRSSNPRRRRTTHRRRNPIGLARVANPGHRRIHRRRRNPIGGGMRMGNIGDMMMNGLKGAVGGIAVNAVVSFLPATFKTGNVLYVSRAALAILIGTMGTKVAGRHARAAAEGALAINFADFINTFAAGKLPGSQLHGVGGEYMGEFLSGQHMYEQLPNASQVQGVGEFLSEVQEPVYSY